MIRKRFKEKFLVGFSVMAFSFMVLNPCSMVAYASESSVVEDVETNGDYGIMPFSDIIEYRYKVIGSDVYRRLYNYTEQCWIGEWELCAEGFIEPGVH